VERGDNRGLLSRDGLEFPGCLGLEPLELLAVKRIRGNGEFGGEQRDPGRCGGERPDVLADLGGRVPGGNRASAGSSPDHRSTQDRMNFAAWARTAGAAGSSRVSTVNVVAHVATAVKA
jgi:hypothetical protein